MHAYLRISFFFKSHEGNYEIKIIKIKMSYLCSTTQIKTQQNINN